MKIPVSSARQPRIEMVPLIDTFFLILAFFISSVLSMEVVRGLPVELPAAIGAAPVPAEDRWTVTLTSSGGLEVEGEPATLEELRERLWSHPRRQSLRVSLRADGLAPYGQVVQVLGIVKEAGVDRVTLLTRPEQKEGFRR